MEPTPKSPEIDALLERVTGKSREDTIRAGKCMTCDGDATEFRDKLSEQEYRISGMCQKCQDSVFGA
jgi:hypothetical protein